MKKSEIINKKLIVLNDIQGSYKSAYKKAESVLMNYSKKYLKDIKYIEVYFHYGWNCNIMYITYKNDIHELIKL